MKALLLLAVILVGTVAFPRPKVKVGKEDSVTVFEGAQCAVCTAVLELTTQYLVIHPQPINHFVKLHLCELFRNTALNFFCKEMVYFFGDTVIHMLLNRSNSDTICQTIYFCQNPVCRLNPLGLQGPNLHASESYKPGLYAGKQKLDFNPIEFLYELYEHFSVNHRPMFDADGDHFSTYPLFRGIHWKGKDCHDANENIYPGRKTNPFSDTNDFDHDCNGISGTDPDTNKPWEEVLCANTTRYGLGVIGDSVGAHFSIPPEYVTAAKINGTTYDDLLNKLADEFDIPHQSLTTGFVEDTNSTPVRSLYKYWKDRNLCNHRDYQNVAVNGGDTNDTDVTMRALARNATTDHPMVVVMELIGNDVCFGYGKTTPPDFFKQGLLNRLAYLDTTLPKGSHVIMLGMVNGSLLYDYLHNETHPIGTTYSAMYDWLNCLELSPCPGWLNSNATERRLTTEAAVEINEQYHIIIKENRTYNNFDYTFYEFPAIEIMKIWVAKGGKPTDLIEPVDGFHSNQLFNALTADWLWDRLQIDQPSWIGDVNPNNQKIKDMFGDQGGYY